jgi:hypothetical protein
MSGSSLTVKIAADVTSLVAQKAVAKVELTDFNATVKNLASQFVGASDEMKGSLNPALQAAAAQAEGARLHIAALNAEIKEMSHPEAAGFFGQLSAGVSETTEKIEGLTSRFVAFQELTTAVGEFVVVGLGVEQVAEKINQVAESGEQMLKLSEETGLTTEQLSGLRVMATETGTDFDSFTKLLAKLPGTMQSAAIDPAGKAGEAFAAMGIKVTDANGQLKPMGDILDEVSAKLTTYADGTNKTALETDIFGAKIGASLIPMLNQLGEIGIQGAIEKSNELNQTWTTQSAEAAEQYEQDMNRAKLAVSGITDAIVRGLLPALDAVASAMAPSLDSQIASVQHELATITSGRQLAERPQMEQQLAALQAQKKSLDDSIAKQTATAGGAVSGSVQAPTISANSGGADWMKDNTATLDKQNQQIEASAGTVKQANAEKLQNTVQFWQGVVGAGNLSSSQELQAQDALSKAETALRSNQLSAGTSANKSAADQRTQIAQAAADAQKQIASSQYAAQVSAWDAEVVRGKMTKAQEIEDEISAQQQIYQSALAEAEQEAALDATGTAAKAKALDDIEVLTAQHNATMAKMSSDLVTQQIADAKNVADQQKQAADATQAAWQKAFQPIGQAFDTSVNGIIQGTQTMQNAELKAAQSITLAFVDAEAKKVESFLAGEAMIVARTVAGELGMTSASIAGNAARMAAKTSADSAGKAEDIALGTAQVNSSAMKAAAGAFSAVAGIPFVGPVLAPVAAATAYAAVMAYDVLSAEGGMVIGAGVNPLVQLHEKEMVLPANISQPLQGALSGGGLGGGDTNVTNHFNMGVAGGAGGTTQDDVLNMLNTAVRSGSLQRYPAIARMMRRG